MKSVAIHFRKRESGVFTLAQLAEAVSRKKLMNRLGALDARRFNGAHGDSQAGQHAAHNGLDIGARDLQVEQDVLNEFGNLFGSKRLIRKSGEENGLQHKAESASAGVKDGLILVVTHGDVRVEVFADADSSVGETS